MIKSVIILTLTDIGISPSRSTGLFVATLDLSTRLQFKFNETCLVILTMEIVKAFIKATKSVKDERILEKGKDERKIKTFSIAQF